MEPQARAEGLVIQDLADEVLVYDLERHKAHCLNPTAAKVWRYCDGRTSLTEMSARLHEELNVPADEGVVWLALEQLDKANLLTQTARRPLGVARPSRRALLIRLGVAGVLLPAVFSIIAPTALAAGTCLANAPGCNPNGANQCNTGSPLQCCSCMCNVISPTMGNCVT